MGLNFIHSTLMNLLPLFAGMDFCPGQRNLIGKSLQLSVKMKPLFKCGICHYQTKRRFNHQRHMLTHSEMAACLLCYICGKKFKSEKGLNLHRLKHEDSFKFRCKTS